MKNQTFLLLLAVFAAVTGGLIWGLNPTAPAYPSIGGGGYDLSKPLYTLLLFVFTSLWVFVTLIISVTTKNPATSRRVLFLAIIGAITALASFIIYSDNLT